MIAPLRGFMSWLVIFQAEDETSPGVRFCNIAHCRGLDFCSKNSFILGSSIQGVRHRKPLHPGLVTQPLLEAEDLVDAVESMSPSTLSSASVTRRFVLSFFNSIPAASRSNLAFENHCSPNSC